MLPILLDLKIIKIYTSGVFLALSFFWGCYLLWKLVRLTAHKEEEIFDGLFLGMIGGMIIGRILYVIFNWSVFGFDFGKIILVNGYPGFSFFGAFFGWMLTFYLYCQVKKIKFIETIDYFIPPFFLSAGFAKLGGFFSGSEIGMPTRFFLSVRYVGQAGLRHPTAVYEAVLFFLAVVITYRLLFDIRREKYHKGFNFFFSLWIIGLVYFIFDKLKSYHLYFLNHSFNRGVSLVLLLTLSFYFLYYFRSVIGERAGQISNSLYLYGQKNYQKIHKRAKDALGRGKKEIS